MTICYVYTSVGFYINLAVNSWASYFQNLVMSDCLKIQYSKWIKPTPQLQAKPLLKDYVIIRQDSGRIITLQTMKSLEEKLPSHIFKRIHRSYIVNLNKIKAVVGNMIEVIEKGQAKHLPVGKNYRDDLLEIINKNRL